MTGKELLEHLSKLSAEELGLEVVTRYMDHDDGDYRYESETRFEVSSVAAYEVPLMWIERKGGRYESYPVLIVG